MSWVRFLQDGLACWGRLENDHILMHSGSPLEPGHHPTEERIPLVATRLLAPCTPTKIVCVGRNYRDHARELGNEVPTEPLFFLKPASALLPPGEPILLPKLSQRVDFEGELAVVIGAPCSHLQQGEDIRPYIFGYTCLNDVTARDLQKTDGQWTRAKGFDTFCPVGPAIVPQPKAGERPWDGLRVETRLNGELRQQGNTSDFIFPLDAILRAITAVMTLEPGDIVATGTPAGVGPLAAGDTVSVTIEGIGTLENPVLARSG